MIDLAELLLQVLEVVLLAEAQIELLEPLLPLIRKLHNTYLI
jgi:hypothetical protein